MSIATEVCMLGKLFERASKLCTKARKRSEGPLWRLQAVGFLGNMDFPPYLHWFEVVTKIYEPAVK